MGEQSEPLNICYEKCKAFFSFFFIRLTKAPIFKILGLPTLGGSKKILANIAIKRSFKFPKRLGLERSDAETHDGNLKFGWMRRELGDRRSNRLIAVSFFSSYEQTFLDTHSEMKSGSFQ